MVEFYLYELSFSLALNFNPSEARPLPMLFVGIGFLPARLFGGSDRLAFALQRNSDDDQQRSIPEITITRAIEVLQVCSVSCLKSECSFQDVLKSNPSPNLIAEKVAVSLVSERSKIGYPKEPAECGAQFCIDGSFSKGETWLNI